jgi:hypothetical protein
VALRIGGIDEKSWFCLWVIAFSLWLSIPTTKNEDEE